MGSLDSESVHPRASAASAKVLGVGIVNFSSKTHTYPAVVVQLQVGPTGKYSEPKMWLERLVASTHGPSTHTLYPRSLTPQIFVLVYVSFHICFTFLFMSNFNMRAKLFGWRRP